MRFFNVYLPIAQFWIWKNFYLQSISNLTLNATGLVSFLKYVQKLIFFGKKVAKKFDLFQSPEKAENSLWNAPKII